jgi:hypothetical protein
VSELTDRALDVHLELIDWHRTRFAQSYYAGMVQAQQEAEEVLGNPDAGYMGLQKDGVRVVGHRMANVIGSTLDHAETIAVTPDMCELLEAAAESIPAYPLQASDLPCPRGWAFFDSGIMVRDRRMRDVVVKAIAWQPMFSGMTEEEFPGPESERPHSAVMTIPELEEGRERVGTVIVIFTDPHDPRDHMWEDTSIYDRRQMPALLYLNHFTWAFGRTSDELVRMEAAETEEAAMSWLHLSNCVAAFFRIVLEPFIDTSMKIPSRGVRRRRERAHVNIPLEGVRVITLRRARENVPAGVPHDSEDGDWYSYRFLVRGHWRNQWYPSQGRHAPKWIEPFVKGPEHAPFVHHDRVYEWKR